MVKVKKFQGYVANQENAHKIISPAYDTLNSDEARKMAEGNEMSFLHVNKPEIDLDKSIDQYDDRVYQKGRDQLKSFIDKGYLVQDQDARMYIYMQKMGNHTQYGLMALTSIEDYENNLIKRHEVTLQKKELDRTKLTDIQNANIGPVFLTFQNGIQIKEKMSLIVQNQQHYSYITCDDGVVHALWKCSVEDSIYFENEFKNIPSLYVCDGHHRTQAAYNVGKQRRDKAIQQGLEVTGEEPFNFFMSLIYPDDNLLVMEYNRLIKEFPEDLTNDMFLKAVKENFDIKQIDQTSVEFDQSQIKPSHSGQYSILLDKQWYKLDVKPEKVNQSSVVSKLDSQIVTDLILSPILTINDLKRDNRIDFSGGIRGFAELERRCSLDCKLAIGMYPTQMKDVMAVADANLIMPPKSTWMEPKPRSGFVVNVFPW